MILRSFKRVFLFLFRLQWKLTLAYTVVTVVVITILMVIAIFLMNRLSYTLPQVGLVLSEALSHSSQVLVPALEQSPPDRTAIRNWISASFQNNTLTFQSTVKGGEAPRMNYSSFASGETLLAVLDAQGNLIDSNHPERAKTGLPLAPEAVPGAAELVARALAGENNLEELLIYQTDRQVIVSPVRRAADGRLLGMVVLSFAVPAPLELLWISLYSILPAVAFISIIAAVIGSLFGAVAARGLVKRLKTATRVTAAWGEGNFSQRINDSSADEIGQLSRDLDKMAVHLQELLKARQELAASEERNRLARELHDSAKQQVFATSMNLAAARALWEKNPDEARKRVEVAAELSRQSQQELTSLIATLHPVQLDRASLGQALRDLATAWERQYGVSVACAADGVPAEFPQEVSQALFRVTQEALANVARHSGATAVEIRLAHGNGEVCLEIKDNGHGFDIDAPVRGLGLRSMQERINALGGSLAIHTGPDGTCLTARAPVLRSAA